MQKALAAASEKQAEKLLTLGLNSTFDDQASFKVVLESVRRRNVQNLDLVLHHDGKEGVPEDYGGGIQAVLSLLFQAIVTVRAKLARILFVDEKLIHVSPEYRPQVLSLLRKLSDEAGFQILMTTNQADYLEGVDGARADLIVRLDKRGDQMRVIEKLYPMKDSDNG